MLGRAEYRDWYTENTEFTLCAPDRRRCSFPYAAPSVPLRGSSTLRGCPASGVSATLRLRKGRRSSTDHFIAAWEEIAFPTPYPSSMWVRLSAPTAQMLFQPNWGSNSGQSLQALRANFAFWHLGRVPARMRPRALCGAKTIEVT